MNLNVAVNSTFLQISAMFTIVSIVEGHGEVEALPILLRHLNATLSGNVAVNIQKPIRIHRDNFLNNEMELKRYVELARSKCKENGWILILLDADDDCPAEKSRALLQKVRQIVPDLPVSVVFANREYESWFIASAATLNGKRGFTFNASPINNPDIIRNAKGWLGDNMGNRKYGEVTDQPAFSSLIDIQQTRRNSRSFQKLCSEWEANILHAEQKEPL